LPHVIIAEWFFISGLDINDEQGSLYSPEKKMKLQKAEQLK